MSKGRLFEYMRYNLYWPAPVCTSGSKDTTAPRKSGIFRRDYSNGNLLSVSLCATPSRSVSSRACCLFESTCLNLSSAKINNCQVSGCGLRSQASNSATAVKRRLTNIINTKLWLCVAPPLLFMRVRQWHPYFITGLFTCCTNRGKKHTPILHSENKAVYTLKKLLHDAIAELFGLYGYIKSRIKRSFD